MDCAEMERIPAKRTSRAAAQIRIPKTEIRTDAERRVPLSSAFGLLSALEWFGLRILGWRIIIASRFVIKACERDNSGGKGSRSVGRKSLDLRQMCWSRWESSLQGRWKLQRPPVARQVR